MKKIPDHIKAAALLDYHGSDMTVLQIAKKFSICPRLIYSWTKAEPRRFNEKNRIAVRLTATETEVIIESLNSYSGKYSEIAETLKLKLETKHEELKEIETANK